MTIAQFWERNRKMYLARVIIQIMFELVFCGLSIYKAQVEITAPCKASDEWGNQLKASVLIMCLLHYYNVVRLAHKIYYFVWAGKKEKASLWKCFLIDCYCCIASFCYMFA